jgi:hypothetical protein
MKDEIHAIVVTGCVQTDAVLQTYAACIYVGIKALVGCLFCVASQNSIEYVLIIWHNGGFEHGVCARRLFN